MKKRLLPFLVAALVLATQAFAQQQKTVTGKVSSEQGFPLAMVQIGVRGTTAGTMTNADGAYSLRVAEGQVLQFRLIGNAPEDRTVGAASVINVLLKSVATNLNAMVVTALGQTTTRRALGTSQQSVEGAAIAQTQRQNFVNAPRAASLASRSRAPPACQARRRRSRFAVSVRSAAATSRS